MPSRVSSQYPALARMLMDELAVAAAPKWNVADALAKLSEGFCPICDSRFKQRTDSVLRCSNGFAYDEVKATVDKVDKAQRIRASLNRGDG